MEEENELISNFYMGLGFIIVVLIILLTSIVLTFVLKKKLIQGIRETPHLKPVLFVMAAVVIGLFFFFSYRLTLYCLDWNAVQNRQFETFTGTVIKYRYVEDINPQSGPVFRDAEDGSIRKFSVGPTKLNGTYTIIYLKHSKVARIIEEH